MLIQEEVEKKSIRLAINTTKVTARTLLRALRAYLNHRKRVKAKDADAILKVMDEYTKVKVKKQKQAERPSVLEKLKKFKDIVARTPKKDKEKRKDLER